MARATEVSCSFARSTGATAAMALPPQMAVPTGDQQAPHRARPSATGASHQLEGDQVYEADGRGNPGRAAGFRHGPQVHVRAQPHDRKGSRRCVQVRVRPRLGFPRVSASSAPPTSAAAGRRARAKAPSRKRRAVATGWSGVEKPCFRHLSAAGPTGLADKRCLKVSDTRRRHAQQLLTSPEMRQLANRRPTEKMVVTLILITPEETSAIFKNEAEE